MEAVPKGKGMLSLSGALGPDDGPALIGAIQSNETSHIILERPEEADPQALLALFRGGVVSDQMQESGYPREITVWTGEPPEPYETLGHGLGPESPLKPMAGGYVG